MNFITNTLWLAEESWCALCHFWPITVTLAVAFVAASIYNFPFLSGRFRPRHLLVLVPLVIAVFILAWGSFMRPSDSQTLAPAWSSQVVTGLLITQALAAIGVVCCMKGYRWFSLFAVLMEMWFGLACAFVATMSVTNDWL